MGTSRGVGAAAGTQTSGLIFGGENPAGSAQLADTESWNGSAWTAGNDLAAVIYSQGGAGATNSAALSIGGNPPAPAGNDATEEWTVSDYTIKTVTVSYLPILTMTTTHITTKRTY